MNNKVGGPWGDALRRRPGERYHEVRQEAQCGRHTLNMMTDGIGLASQAQFVAFIEAELPHPQGTFTVQTDFIVRNTAGKKFATAWLKAHTWRARTASRRCKAH